MLNLFGNKRQHALPLMKLYPIDYVEGLEEQLEDKTEESREESARAGFWTGAATIAIIVAIISIIATVVLAVSLSNALSQNAVLQNNSFDYQLDQYAPGTIITPNSFQNCDNTSCDIYGHSSTTPLG